MPIENQWEGKRGRVHHWERFQGTPAQNVWDALGTTTEHDQSCSFIIIIIAI